MTADWFHVFGIVTVVRLSLSSLLIKTFQKAIFVQTAQMYQ